MNDPDLSDKLPIRIANPEDVANLLVPDTPVFQESAYSPENWQHLIRTGLVLLAENPPGRVAGFIAGTRGQDAEIHKVYSGIPGLGSRLLQKFLDCLRSETTQNVYLEVRDNNDRARRLYERFKFIESGIRKKYYPDGGNAVLLHLDLCRESDDQLSGTGETITSGG